jgi:hypothetical protein
MHLGNQLTVNLAVTSDEVTVQLTDRRPQTVVLFGELSGEQGPQFAAEVWTVGLRAVANAHARAQEARLEDIGKRLLEGVDRQLTRFIGEHGQTLGKFLDPENGQVAKSLAAFVDDKGALSQVLTSYGGDLVKALETKLREVMVDEHDAIGRTLDPLSEESAIARFLKSLRDLLTEHAGSNAEALAKVLEAITRLETKKNYDQKSTRGGVDFEAAVVDFATAVVRGGPWVVEATGNTPGHVTRSRMGDLVIRATEESAFAGAGVVFEAKHDKSYTAASALEELNAARVNRNANVGVFVMAKSHAPDSFPPFERHGRNVLVVWDETDPSTNMYLHAAVLLGLGLVPLNSRVGGEGDIKALADIQGPIEAELARMSKMEGFNEEIRKNSDNLTDEIRKAKGQFGTLLSKAKASLTALNVELHDEAMERRTPIGLQADSLGHATAALVANGEAAAS